MNEIINNEFEIWVNSQQSINTYLGLEYDSSPPNSRKFTNDIPPMQIIGDWDNLNNKLILISLEPKYDYTNYEQQQQFIYDGQFPGLNDRNLVSQNRYIKWQKDYFKPNVQDIINTTNSGYWNNIKKLIEGYNNEICLDKGLVELPLIPMHSETHRPEIHSINQIQNLLKLRLEYILENSKTNKIICLGSDTKKYIKDTLGLTEEPLLYDLVRDSGIEENEANIHLYGNAFFNKKIEVYQYFLNDKKLYIFTRSVLSHGHQPKSPGIIELGKIIKNKY